MSIYSKWCVCNVPLWNVSLVKGGGHHFRRNTDHKMSLLFYSSGDRGGGAATEIDDRERWMDAWMANITYDDGYVLVRTRETIVRVQVTVLQSAVVASNDNWRGWHIPMRWWLWWHTFYCGHLSFSVLFWAGRWYCGAKWNVPRDKTSNSNSNEPVTNAVRVVTCIHAHEHTLIGIGSIRLIHSRDTINCRHITMSGRSVESITGKGRANKWLGRITSKHKIKWH